VARPDPALSLRLHRALVLLAAVAAFLPGIFGEFVGWDDDRNFLDHAAWRGLGWRPLAWMITSWHMGHYIPVTWLTLGLDHVVWGMNPTGFHLTSLAFHGATSLAVLALARRLIGRARPQSDPFALGLGALAAALLFAAHPLRVESVVWITERRDVVSGLLAVLCVLAYLGAVERGMANGLHRGWYVTSVITFALAVFAKSIVVTLPLTILLLDVYPLRRLHAGSASSWPRIVAEKMPFLALAAVASGLTLAAGHAAGSTASLEALGPGDRLRVALYGLGFYLGKTLVPSGLSPLYGVSRLETTSGTVLVLLGGAFVVALVAGSIRRWWPRPLLVAGAAYVVGLLPVLGLTQSGSQIAADRYSYLATLSWAVLVGGTVTRALAGGTDRRVPRALVLLPSALAVVILVAASAWQSLVWHDSVTLWSHAVELDPGSAEARANLGTALLREGHVEAAAVQLEQSVRMNRRIPEALVGLAIVRSLDGRPAEAVLLAGEAVTLRPGEARLHAAIGGLRRRAGDLEGALRAFQTSLALSPRPETQYEIALTLAALGRPTEAASSLEAGHVLARRLGDADREGHRYTALVYTKSDPVRAAEAWDRYLALMRQLPRPTRLDQARIADGQSAIERLRGSRPRS
jgi:Flp pilus assembly protein TadD